MEYKGYMIERENDHCKVIAPDGREWTEDTVADAMRAIDQEE